MAALTRGTCPACSTSVALRKDGEVREHRPPDPAAVDVALGAPCPGSGQMALAEGEAPAVDPATSVARRKGETAAAWRKRLEGAGHRMIGSKANPTHDHANCEACAAIDAPAVHPATGEYIEPSLAQQQLADELPPGPWAGATIAEVSPLDLEPDPDNARGDDYGDLSELAASLVTEGMLLPIIAVAGADPGKYRIVAGHRRYAAALLANLAVVPVLVRPDLADARRLAAAQATENLQRRQLNAIQEARAYRRLADAGAKQDEIAARVGVNQGHISKRLSLLKLPADAQDAVASGAITVENAVEVARLPKAAQPIAVALLLAGERNAIARAKTEAEHAEAIQAVLARLEADGVAVIEWPGYSWSYDDGVPLMIAGARPRNVYATDVLDQTPAKHKRCPGHVATISPHDLEVVYLCTDPALHGIPTPAERGAERNATFAAERAEREAREAAERAGFDQLWTAARAVAGGKIARPAMAEFIASSYLLGSVHDETVTLPWIADVWDEALAVLDVLGSPAVEAITADDDGDPTQLVEVAFRAAMVEHGYIRVAFAGAVLATTRVVARRMPGWSQLPGDWHLVSYFDLLTANAGYELTDNDRAWLTTPAPSWTAPPVPDVVPDATDDGEPIVAWFVGGPEEEPRFVGAAEAGAIEEAGGQLVPVTAPPAETAAGDQPELVPGDRCPGSGREFAGNGASASGVAGCQVCGRHDLDTDRKGCLVDHVVAVLEPAPAGVGG